jgi:hypothetical protein
MGQSRCGVDVVGDRVAGGSTASAVEAELEEREAAGITQVGSEIEIGGAIGEAVAGAED